MNEYTKTISLVVAAAAVLLLAVATRQKPPVATTDDLIGKPLFASLNDPLKAKRMRIVTFDEGTSSVRDFEVSQAGGVWSLPSHKNYPADAKDQMAAAAGTLVDLKVLGIVSKDKRDHELYGVVEPDPSNEQLGQKGIGKLIVLEDESNKPLARLIIGKQDKTGRPEEIGGTQNELRFVRVPGQDPVYRVALATDKFSTKFSDWIETDLLKVNPWDIHEVRLRDYSVSERMAPSGDVMHVLNQRADITVDYDDRNSKWSLAELLEYKSTKPDKVALTADQQLNSSRLNEMRDALDNLKIVNISRKPAQMSANLQAGKDFLSDEEALRDLTRRGFLPVPTGDNEVDIVSNDGEVTVRMKDGVEYVLRFGAIAGIDSQGENKGKEEESKNAKDDTAKPGPVADSKPDEQAGSGEKDKGGLNRYIMVMAQFNPDLIPKPELAPVPEVKTAPPKSSEQKLESATKAGQPKASDAKAPGSAANNKPGETAKGTAPTPQKEEAKADSKDAAANASGEDLEALEAERDKIEKENRRKQEEYDEKIKKGQQRAKDLNARFADWYYVVNDDTYRKVHLGKADIVQNKPKDAGQSSPPANPFNLPGALPSAQPN